MPTPQSSKGAFGCKSQPSGTDDQELIRNIGRGDELALRELMNRYDRLVRYTVFRTARNQSIRDPHWLDAVASETWNGFVAAARRGVVMQAGSASGYLSGVARQQAISALRRASTEARHTAIEWEAGRTETKESTPDPHALMEDLEALQALRECISMLPEDDRIIMTQLSAITQRRWLEAGKALSMSESTLRSRWARIVENLKELFQKKSAGVSRLGGL